MYGCVMKRAFLAACLLSMVSPVAVMAKKAPRGVSKPDREAKPGGAISEKLLCKGKKIFFDGKCRGRKFLKKLMAPGVDQSKGGFQGARYNQIRKKDSVLVVIESLDDGYRSVIVEAKAGGKSSKSTQRNGYRVGMEVSTVYDWVNIAGPDRSGDYPRKTRSWSTPSKNGKRLKVRHWEQTIFYGTGSYEVVNSDGVRAITMASRGGGSDCIVPDKRDQCAALADNIRKQSVGSCVDDLDRRDNKVLGAGLVLTAVTAFLTRGKIFQLLSGLGGKEFVTLFLAGGGTGGAAYFKLALRADNRAHCEALRKDKVDAFELAGCVKRDVQICPPARINNSPTDCPEGQVSQPTKGSDWGYCDPDRMNCSCGGASSGGGGTGSSGTGSTGSVGDGLAGGGRCESSSDCSGGYVCANGECIADGGGGEMTVEASKTCYIEMEVTVMACAPI